MGRRFESCRKRQILHMRKTIDTNKLGFTFFNLGSFFLSSALPISALFFLVSICFSFFKEKYVLIKDKYNLLLLICGGLMVLKNLSIFISESLSNSEDEFTILVDLVNWIPFFFLFVFFQKYLITIRQRRIFSKVLIIGSFPVFISCILQYWLNVYGPFETMNGLIVWFQKPIEENHGGVTGLFNNQNYTGLWLTAILPFLIAEFRLSIKYKLFNIFLIIFDIYLIFLTTSKNAFLGLFITFIMIFGIRSKLFIYLLGILGSFLCATNLLNRFNFDYINLFSLEIYEKILSFNFFTSSRYEIYRITSELISQKPFLGWGKSLFSELYISNGGSYLIDHTHSMPLEIAFNYGLPISIILMVFTFTLIVKGWFKVNSKLINNENILFDKCWIVSSFTIVISHLNDITYYDGKISLLIWILFSGIRCIIRDNYITKED